MNDLNQGFFTNSVKKDQNNFLNCNILRNLRHFLSNRTI
jgi:hypothetical protein